MKTALITGGTRGIGKACVTAFINKGYKVAFIYKNSESEAQDLANEYGAFAIRADVTSPDEVRNAVKKALAELGKIDVLVNNAGISHIGLIQDMTDTEWRTLLDTNLSGAFYTCREVAPEMIRNRYGRIINVGSVWGRLGASCEAAYSASKAGLRGLTSALAKELGPSGITVNCIEPGVIETDMNSHFSEETLSDLVDSTPLMRLGQPCDVANAVLFLASDGASFITGQFLGVDGGFPT